MSWHLAWLVPGVVLVVLAVLRAMPVARVVIWSSMKGRVLLNGEPASGAELVRDWMWHWTNGKGSDRTVAGADGEFSLPVIYGRSLLGVVLPHEPVIEQFMEIAHQGKSYRAWAYFKRGYEHDDENHGRPIRVTCRLEVERAVHGEVSGVCEFE